jgi:hypothetical protein
MRLPAVSAARENVRVGTKPRPWNYTARLPVKAAWGGAGPPRAIFACGGFVTTPATVERRLTISAGSPGALVP